MPLYPAAATDLDAVADLVNAAYRGTGEGSWTTEAGYISGQRTNSIILRQDLDANPAARLMLLRDLPDGELLGTVWLEPAEQGAWYLGMLTVRPGLQDRGFGRRLLDAAESFAAEQGASRLRMTVVHIRDTLIAWYRRRGYEMTGEIQAFPYGDDRFGIPLRDDLSFVVLEKPLNLT